MGGLRRALAGLAGAALLASGCAERGAEKDGELRGAVVFLLDTLRADHSSAYGYPRPTTPALERLAARGVVFERAISYAPWTLPAVAALLSGRPAELAFDRDRGRLSASLVESFRRAGFATAAFTEGGLVSGIFGFDRGFDVYREVRSRVPLLGSPLRPEAAGAAIEETFAAARAWLAEHRDERFLLLVHTYEPHAPYERHTFAAGLETGAVGPSFRIEQTTLLRRGELRFDADDLRYLAALYDGGVHEGDRQVGLFLDFLGELGLAGSTAVVVTSDHGEDLGERDPAFAGDHGHGLHEELLRVPLVLWSPADPRPPRRVATPVWTLDLLPTLAELLGVPLAAEVEGRSLVPLLRGEDAAPRVIFGGAVKSGPLRHFARDGDWKYVAGEGGARLYHLGSDPGERRDLAAREPERMRRFARFLEERADFEPLRIEPFLAAIAREGEGAALRAQLRALGYLEEPR